MFGIFKKKRALTPQEDLDALLNYIYDQLRIADRKTDPEQMFMIASVFGSSIPIIRERFPNVPIENDSPAMMVLSAGSENPDWASIDTDIAHILQQVRTCPIDRETRSILIRYFLSPRYVAEKMALAKDQ